MNILKLKNKENYRFIYNSVNLAVFHKNEKTNRFLKENNELYKLTNEINQETSELILIPIGLEEFKFRSIIKKSSLIENIDYIQYSIIQNEISSQLCNSKLNDIFKEIIFTSEIDNRLNDNIYNSFTEEKLQFSNYKNFISLINRISQKDSKDWDGMRIGKSVLYISMIFKLCYNEINDFKDLLLKFQDLNKLIEYKNKTNNPLNKNLISEYLNCLPDYLEDNKLSSLASEEHGWNTLVFLNELS